MDKSNGQDAAASRRGPGSEQTRVRLLRAAAELIAEQGWGAVRTRAVAERAGLPHGAVSYHFRGKQELLTEAALYTFAQALPLEELAGEPGTSADLVDLVEGWLTGTEVADPVVAGVGMEAMLQAERDPVLRRRLAELMSRYREALTGIVRDSQRRKTTRSRTDPAGLAALLAALGDGLFLHARIDPELDTAAALTALRDLLTR
jgi:AcrR family transcriptional regulator